MKNFKIMTICFSMLFSFLLNGQQNSQIVAKKSQITKETSAVATEASTKNIIGINNGMPNRISMNVTVAKQTQGATFGEKVHNGTINVNLTEGGCVVLFGASEGYKVSTIDKSITALNPSEILAFGEKVNQGLHAPGSALAQGSSLLGGALPGGSIISAVVSSVGNLAGSGSGAAAASYAKNSKQVYSIQNEASVTELALADGEYNLVFIILEKATSGLKDTLKTQVRMGFDINNGLLTSKHETAKNSVSNIR